ncbi:MAG: asparagine synthase (glutamine-hydrolyzing), partial [Candidatus Hydrogenedentota bacterium]
QQGYNFKTNTNTEIILYTYEAYDIKTFNKFNGMFAFCLWDNNKDVVYLVRDQFGIKPLYVYEDNRQIVFASELKAILALSELDLTLDPLGFQDYLTFRYIQAPYTFFERIKRVEAGTFWKIKNGKITRYRYYDLAYHHPYPYPPLDEVKETLQKKFQSAVQSQLMGEVPIGVLLSGGVDSSSIAYYIHTLGANLTTFNIGFPDVNEFEYSREVARQFCLKHVEISVTPKDFLKNFATINAALDEPIADPACLPLYCLGEELKKHVTVVLSGEGGDEVFGGYPQYLRTLQAKLPYNDQFHYFLEHSYYFLDGTHLLRAKTIPPLHLRHKKYFEELPLLSGMLAYDMKTWIPENLMMKADKILMAHSLEGRFPFLDRDLFEYAATLPQHYKISPDGTTKWLLKEIMTPHLPKNNIKKKKMGFTVPVDRMLLELKTTVLQTFNELQHSVVSEVLDTEMVQRLVQHYYKGRSGSALQVWTLFVMAYWFIHSFSSWNASQSKSSRSSYKQIILREQKHQDSQECKKERNMRTTDAIRYKVTKPFLRGNGIEIGAGANPQPLPEGVTCEYYDKRTEDELVQLFQVPKADIPKVHSLDTFWKRFPQGADFLIAHHVLEHTSNPIKTLITWNSLVKEGGVLVISVPDARYCPDQGRLLPPFEHILYDYLFDRDDDSFESREHIYSFVMGWIDDGFAKNMDKFNIATRTHQSAHAAQNDLHWHAFNEQLLNSIVTTAALLSKRNITIEAIASPDRTEPYRTTGDIIYVYRLKKDLKGQQRINDSLIEIIRKIDKELLRAQHKLAEIVAPYRGQ